MKKTLAYILLAIILNLSLINIGFADGPQNATDILKKLEEAGPCVPKADIDAGYSVVVIEEPINLDGNLNFPTGDGTTKVANGGTCFRVTIDIKNTEGDYVKGLDGKLLAKCPTDEANENVEVYCKQVQVILTKGGTELISYYIGMVYRLGATLGGLIAVIVIVISGMQIALSGGDIDAAKGRIIKSIAGLAVLFMSGVILYTVNPNFFVQ